MIQLCKRHGIGTGTFIMLGYPGETAADIEATIEHLKRADPDQFTITVSYPIKGTPFYDDVVNDIVNPAPWEQATDRDIELRRPYSSWYYWFATTRVVSEVRAFKLGARDGRRAAAGGGQAAGQGDARARRHAPGSGAALARSRRAAGRRSSSALTRSRARS